MANRFLAMIVMLLLALPITAHAESVLWHDEKTNILAMWEHEGSTYLFTNKSYYILNDMGPTEEHPFSIVLENGEIIEDVVPGDDALWALLADSDGNPSLAELLFDDAGNISLGEQISFDWEDILDESEPVITYPMVCDGGFAFTDTYAALPDGKTLMIADWYTAWAYSLRVDEEAPMKLSISADEYELPSAAYYEYLKENPGANAMIDDNHIDVGAISKAILAQSTQYDVYVTSLNWQDYTALYDKGYLPPLSGSEVLTEFAGVMYPAVQNAITKDGALVAFPIDYNLYTPTYNPAAFAALGLTEEDVPTTLMEFLRFLERAPELIEGTDYTAFDPMNTASELPGMVLSYIFDAYELYLESDPSVGMRFDTDLLHALLAEYEKIDFSGLGAMDQRSEYQDRSGEGNILFEMEGWASCEAVGGMRGYYYVRYGADAPELSRPMPLALENGMEPILEANLTVAIMNPYSQNQDVALRYLETVAALMPETLRANLCPNWTEPIKAYGADEALAEVETRIAALGKEVAAATGDNQARYQAMLDEAKTQYAEYQAYFYWLVTGDNLAAYRVLAQHMHVWHYFGLNTEGEGEFKALIDQYLNGVIDGDAMLHSIDQKVNMMLLED